MIDAVERMLTIAETAAILSVPPVTVYKAVAAGRLPAMRVSERSLRVSRSDLEAYLTRLNPERSSS